MAASAAGAGASSGYFLGSPSGAGAGAGSTLSSIGGYMAIAGLLTSTIGSYYAAKTAQNQAKSAALNLEYQKSISQINARKAENDAQSILEAGEQQIGQVTRQYGQVKSANKASTGGRGIRTDVGSASEVEASIELAKEIDRMTINTNSVRAAADARAQGAGYRSQALLSGVSAENMRRSARTINPWVSAGTSFLGGSGQVASQWADIEYRRNRSPNRY